MSVWAGGSRCTSAKNVDVVSIHSVASTRKSKTRSRLIVVGTSSSPITDRESEANATRSLAAVVGERLRAEVVAGQKELPAALVPDRKREVAEEVVDAVLPPLAVGIEEQATVSDLGDGCHRAGARR